MYFTLIAQFTDENVKTLDKSAEQFSVISLLVCLNHNLMETRKPDFFSEMSGRHQHSYNFMVVIDVKNILMNQKEQ